MLEVLLELMQINLNLSNFDPDPGSDSVLPMRSADHVQPASHVGCVVEYQEPADSTSMVLAGVAVAASTVVATAKSKLVAAAGSPTRESQRYVSSPSRHLQKHVVVVAEAQPGVYVGGFGNLLGLPVGNHSLSCGKERGRG